MVSRNQKSFSSLDIYSHLWMTGWFFVIVSVVDMHVWLFPSWILPDRAHSYTHIFSVMKLNSAIDEGRQGGMKEKQNQTIPPDCGMQFPTIIKARVRFHRPGWWLCSVMMKQRSEIISSWDPNKQKTIGAQILKKALILYQPQFSSFSSLSGTKGE